MKKLFLLITITGFFILSSCGSTQSCRTRQTSQNIKQIQKNTLSVIASIDYRK